jgi:hypothetical protein
MVDLEQILLARVYLGLVFLISTATEPEAKLTNFVALVRDRTIPTEPTAACRRS